jgi:NAD(P)-dependent dehydrogenase (short-subunit alcohol dehydrogenase family)
MRNLARGEELRVEATAERLPLELIELDVTSNDSVEAAFAAVRAHGPVDVLVNNAGIGGATPLELVPEHEHRAIFETNYWGCVRCIQAVLPGMRERGRGAIANISSLTGILATPSQIPYSASKWALECLSEALAHEVRRFGVRIVLIEPGIVMTKIFENAAGATRYDRGSPYRQVMRRNRLFFIAGFKQAAHAEQVADVILESITTPDYRLRWPVGIDAEAVARGLPKLSDEAWVAMGDDLSDEEYNRRFYEAFGITL